MDENQLPENPGSAEQKGCINCDSNAVEENYPTRLCSGCRQQFIKFPIPLWVKIFGTGIGLVLVLALFSFPKNLTAGIHFEQARQYEKKKRYKSAQREYTRVLQLAPDNLEANAHTMIAAFYNRDFAVFINTADRLSGKNFEDQALYDRLDDMVNRVKADMADSTLQEIRSDYENETAVPDSVYTNYLKGNPFNIYALYTYAGRLYQRSDYIGSDTLLQRILGVDTEHMMALHMLTTVKRELGQWEESIKYSEKIISLNREAGYAYANLARTYLKWNKLNKGLEFAEKSVAVDKEDPYNKVTLAIAWHLNNQPLKRDDILKEMKGSKDTAVAVQLQYAMEVINNKESL